MHLITRIPVDGFTGLLVFLPQVERRDSKPCVGTVARQDVGNTGQFKNIKRKNPRRHLELGDG